MVAGLIAMLVVCARGRTPTAGPVYHWSLLVDYITATIASILRSDENYHLFILGVLAFAADSLGRTARRQRWPAWVTMHISGMVASDVLLLTAFYVHFYRSEVGNAV
jgi:hypothetical protein